MKIFFLFVIFFFVSCSYPDIDSVPDFNDIKLTEDELYDLCELSLIEKNQIEACVKEMLKNKWKTLIYV